MPPQRKKKATNTKRYFNLVENGNLRALKRQVSHDDCDLVNDRDTQGYTYLHRSVSTANCDLPTLNYLLAEAPQLTNVTAKDGKTPLCVACQTEYIKPLIIELLLTTNINVIDIPDNNGYTPLCYLVKSSCWCSRNEKIVKYLIKHRANVTIKIKGVSILQKILSRPYWHISESFKVSMLEELIKNGFKIVPEKSSLWSCVTSVRLVKLLLQIDSSHLNHVDKEGKTKLHHILEGKGQDIDEVYTYLVQQGAEVAPGVDIFALVRKSCSNFSTIEALMKKHPNYDINTKDSEGRTLLMQYGYPNETLKKILLLGGKVLETSNNGCTRLAMCEDADCIKTLIEAGADPLQFTTPDLSVGGNVLGLCSTEYGFDEWIDTFKYILNLPQIKESTSEKKEELYKYILKTLFHSEFEFCYQEKLQELLSCVYKANNDIVHMKFSCEPLNQLEDKPLNLFTFTSENMLSLLGFAILEFVATDEDFIFETEFYKFRCFVDKILDSVFALPDVKIDQEGCISPLTLFLLVSSKLDKENDSFYDSEDEYEDENIEKKIAIFKSFIKKGCNVNSMSLQLSDPDLNEIKQKLQVPDVLYISLLSSNVEYVEIIIPYWWGPPLALLLFCDCELLDFWLPIFLEKYGVVPRGMSLYHSLHTHLEDLDLFYDEDEDEFDSVWKLYMEEISKSPLSLQSMCKYAVRKLVAERVPPGHKLSDVLRDNLPPLLRSLVLH